MVDPLEAHGGADAHHLVQQSAHLVGPPAFHLGNGRAGGHEAGRGGRSDLVDGRQVGGQMVGPGELEQHDRAFDGQEQVPRRIPLVKDLHVAGPGGVAHVHRIEQQAGVDAVVNHPGPQTVLPEVDEGLKIDAGGIERRVGHSAHNTHRAALGAPGSVRDPPWCGAATILIRTPMDVRYTIIDAVRTALAEVPTFSSHSVTIWSRASRLGVPQDILTTVSK